MAEPKLEIEKRMDQVEERQDRHEKAISTMAQWLVQAQTGFGVQDASGIEQILRGEKSEASKEDIDT